MPKRCARQGSFPSQYVNQPITYLFGGSQVDLAPSCIITRWKKQRKSLSHSRAYLCKQSHQSLPPLPLGHLFLSTTSDLCHTYHQDSNGVILTTRPKRRYRHHQHHRSHLVPSHRYWHQRGLSTNHLASKPSALSPPDGNGIAVTTHAVSHHQHPITATLTTSAAPLTARGPELSFSPRIPPSRPSRLSQCPSQHQRRYPQQWRRYSHQVPQHNAMGRTTSAPVPSLSVPAPSLSLPVA